MTALPLKTLLAVFALISLLFSPMAVNDVGGNASRWTDGNDLSVAHPHYGIHDIIAEMALLLFEELEPGNSTFLTYWYIPNGSDSNPDSFESRRKIPGPEDNFLAYTDDVLDDWDGEDYFINHGKPWDQKTTAPIEAQKIANRTIENLTAWLLEGSPEGSPYQHKAAYNAGILSHFIGDMSQFGHTDYSTLDRATRPAHDPDDDFYYRYYESHVWKDEAMTSLIEDFENQMFNIPDPVGGDQIHQLTADHARWVNSRDGSTEVMTDATEPPSNITVGSNYKRMLELFKYNWDHGTVYRNTTGFNQTLWELTLENLIAGAENLTAAFMSIYNTAYRQFLDMSADLNVVNWSVEPESPISGDIIAITASVRNVGLKAATEFIVALSLSDGQSDTKVMSLLPGQTKNITFALMEMGTSTTNLTINADKEKTVVEADEEDNTITGTIVPIPEIHGSMLSLSTPHPDQRRDSSHTVTLLLSNTGNRQDTFMVSGSCATEGVTVEGSGTPVLMSPYSSSDVEVVIDVENISQTGLSTIELSAVGLNSTADLSFDIDILERTQDPIPSIEGRAWARSEDLVTLSAEGSTDPDGDVLYFRWIVPIWGNLTSPAITINFTQPGEYPIILEVYDGNVTRTTDWNLVIYPKVPANLSSRVDKRGLSAISVAWKEWKAGGLTAYWLYARALDGQGGRSEKGPFLVRFGPGNTSGRVGWFFPDTEVEVTFHVEAEYFGNVSMNTLMTSTASTGPYEQGLSLALDSRMLKVQFKPWAEEEGEMKPTFLLERHFGGFIEFDAEMENITLVNEVGAVHFTMLSNTGRYRVTLTYYWAGGATELFTISKEISVPNVRPNITLVSPESNWALNVNGTVRINLQLAIDDPEDTVEVTVDWGDGSMDTYLLYHTASYRLFHNYSEVGEYLISIKGVDWSGGADWFNMTLGVAKYKPPGDDDTFASNLIKIVLLVIFFLLLVGVIFFFGRLGYKFAKKTTEVDFEADELKKRPKKAGTDTDFDQRREMQIPKESIMGARRPEPDYDESADSSDLQDGDLEEVDQEQPEMIEGDVIFDDEE